MRNLFTPFLAASLLSAASVCHAATPPIEPFVKAFMASCTSEDAKGKAFYLSHIRFPLRYRFTMVSGEGNESSSGTLKSLEINPHSGGLALPVCMGDGGLQEVEITPLKHRVVVRLTFGSGPNEELWFQVVKGRWQLVFAEWFDH